MQARVDEFVSLGESISMTREDELVLLRLALDAERSEAHRRDADRYRVAGLAIKDPMLKPVAAYVAA